MTRRSGSDSVLGRGGGVPALEVERVEREASTWKGRSEKSSMASREVLQGGG